MRWKGEILSAESCCSYQRLSTVWGVVEEAPSPACCSLLAASLLPRLPGDSWGTPALQPLLFICQGGWKEQLEMGCSKNRNLMLAINQDVHTSLWLACGALYTSVYLVWLTAWAWALPKGGLWGNLLIISSFTATGNLFAPQQPVSQWFPKADLETERIYVPKHKYPLVCSKMNTATVLHKTSSMFQFLGLLFFLFLLSFGDVKYYLFLEMAFSYFFCAFLFF